MIAKIDSLAAKVATISLGVERVMPSSKNFSATLVAALKALYRRKGKNAIALPFVSDWLTANID
ncbi:hypothetical protein [Argonema antarcticum]|uniref:hypothetical protein n=1 Tax=Argonema antarcticum TaxID=2942763 RepID=UPI002011809D|nr:hypothetical protein [Argonema antarcticum]MCL1471836.1 hypothetical protein [Argonema antarcticum A004/B2]